MRRLLLTILMYSLWTFEGAICQDWLLDISSYQSSIELAEDGSRLILSNGLIERRIRLSPFTATTEYQHLGQASNTLLRSVRPEALVVLNGVQYAVGGCKPLPNGAFFEASWLEDAQPLDNAFRYDHISFPKTIPCFLKDTGKHLQIRY